MKHTTLAALLAASFLPSHAALADDAVTLRFSVPNPSRAAVCAQVAQPWAEAVEAAAPGKVKIEVTCDSTLSKVGDTFDRVESGIADIGWDLPARYGKRFASFNALTVPGLYSDVGETATALWTVYENGQIGPDSEMQGLKVLWFNVAPNGGLYMNGALENAADLDGKKIAVGNSVRATMVKEMGGVPLSLDVKEYYQSISKGAADGTLTTSSAIVALKINEVTDHYINGPFGGGLTFFAMNQAKFDSLDADVQAAIMGASGAAMSAHSSVLIEEESDARFAELAEGKDLRTLTEAELAAWQVAFDKATAEWIEGNPEAAESLAALQAELNK